MRGLVNNDTESAVVLHQILSAALLRKFNISEDEARLIADELASGVREEAGSQKLYIPAPNRKRRNEAIRREWNGNNSKSLARKYGLSVRQIERVVAGARCRDPESEEREAAEAHCLLNVEPDGQRFEFYGLFQAGIERLEGWNIDEAKEADSKWRQACRIGRSPLFQWGAWNNLIPPLEAKHEAGDPTALFMAIAHCHNSGLPLPHWCGKAVSLGLSKIERAEARTWDDVFLSPNKGRKLPAIKSEREKKTPAVMDVLARVGTGSPVDSTIRAVAGDYAVSYELLRAWYYDYRNTYPTTEQVREDGVYRKETGQSDSEYRKVEWPK